MSEGYSTEESEMEDLKEKKAELEQIIAEQKTQELVL